MLYIENNTKLSWLIGSGVVCDNNMSDCTGALYVENDTKLWWSIGLIVDCDENQIG